jgi:thiamine kinase-like enzyme
MHRFPDFPATPEALTANWLTAVFRAHGLDVAVEGFSHHRIGTGQIGQNHRYAITYTDAISATRQHAPHSVVGKFVSPDATSRTTGLMMGIYAKEATFYQQLAPSLEGRMRVPRCWVSEFDAGREATLVLMEDLAPAVQGDQMAGCSVATAELAVRELAALHSTFWEHDALAQTPELGDPKDPMRAMILKALMDQHWPAFIDRYRESLTPDMIELGSRLTSCIDQWVLSRSGPLTLTHNDYRADNLMITPTWTAAVDWQTVSVGFAGVDLGYFLGASLLPDDRRTHQDRLIDSWHRLLVENGVTNYSRSRAWDDYRHGQFAGFVTAVVSSMITQRTDRGDDMFWAMAGRHLNTALETDAASLLP